MQSATSSERTATDSNRADDRHSSDDHHAPPSATSHVTVPGNKYY